VYDYNRSKALEPFFTTNNIALAADLFREVGGFTTAIPSATAEDKEFCDRWRVHGLSLAHVPSAVVHHAHELTFTQFLRQHFNYGRGTLVFRLIRRHRTNSAFVPNRRNSTWTAVAHESRDMPRPSAMAADDAPRRVASRDVRRLAARSPHPAAAREHR
jgi:GT2 family glycosyltransferase